MAEQRRDKIEYEFEDLRRNSDPVSNLVLAQLGIEASDETDDERHEGRNRREARSGRDDDDDGHDVDDDEEVTLTRKELSRRLIRERQKAERNAARAIEAAKEEAAEVIGKLEKRLDGIERKGKAEEIDQEFATKRADLEAKIEEAMEKGESKQVAALTIELSELIADHRIKRAESSRRVTDDSPDDRGQDADRDKPRKGMIPRAREWVEQQDWFELAGYDEERRYLNRLDAELQRRGYRPTDDDYYELLEEKLDERFPGLITRTMRGDGEDDEDDEEDDEEFYGDRRSQRRRSEFDDIPDKRRSSRERQRRASRRAPVNSGGHDASRRDPDRGGRRQKTLSRAQIANMRAFGMDPDNKEHVEAYLAGV